MIKNDDIDNEELNINNEIIDKEELEEDQKSIISEPKINNN